MSYLAYIGLLDRGGVAEVIPIDQGKPAKVVPYLKKYTSAAAVRELLAMGGLDRLGPKPVPSPGVPGSHKSFKFPIKDVQNAGRIHNADNVFLLDESDGHWKQVDLNVSGREPSLERIAARIAARRIAALS